MNNLYSNRHLFSPLSIHYIILLTVFLNCFLSSAADSCSVVDNLDILQLCLVDDPRQTPTLQIDLGFSDDATHQDDHYMLGNYIRQTTRSLRFSPSPLRSLVPSSSYLATSRAFTTVYRLASTPNLKQASTMASSSSPLPAEASLNDQQQQQQQQQQQHTNAENEANNSNEKLALPPVPEAGEAQKLDVSGQTGTTVSLDHLGPIVVNQDGTMSRISNWDKMTEIEKKNTLRIIGKRNKQRLEALKAAGVGGEGEEGSVS